MPDSNVHQSNDTAQDVGPTGLPFGCNCDPYDCGPAAHSADCPAVVPEKDWINRYRRHIPLFDSLIREVERQDGAYGGFRSPFSHDEQLDVGSVRLAVAALEDEAEEVRRAWRSERKVDGWPDTTAEALQVAAVALRLVRDAG